MYDKVAMSAEHPTHLRGAATATATPSEGAEPPSSINEDNDGADDLVRLVRWCEFSFTDIARTLRRARRFVVRFVVRWEEWESEYRTRIIIEVS